MYLPATRCHRLGPKSFMDIYIVKLMPYFSAKVVQAYSDPCVAHGTLRLHCDSSSYLCTLPSPQNHSGTFAVSKHTTCSACARPGVDKVGVRDVVQDAAAVRVLGSLCLARLQGPECLHGDARNGFNWLRSPLWSLSIPNMKIPMVGTTA